MSNIHKKYYKPTGKPFPKETNNGDKKSSRIPEPTSENFLDAYDEDLWIRESGGTRESGVCDCCERNVDVIYYQSHYEVFQGKEIKKLCFECCASWEPEI